MLPQSLEFYEQALARAPGDPTIASLLGGCAGRMGEIEISERCYRVAAQLEPSDWVHVSNLGGALRDQGKFDEAVEILRNAIFVHPEAADLWNTLGTVLQEQGRAEEALVHWCTARGLAARPLNIVGYGEEDEASGEAGAAEPAWAQRRQCRSSRATRRAATTSSI